MSDHIKFTRECPDNERSIPFLDPKCTPYPNHTKHTTVCRKSTHRDRYLDWKSNHPISIIQALTNRAKNMLHLIAISLGDGLPKQGSMQEQLLILLPEKN